MDRLDDLGVVDALAVDRGDAEVRTRRLERQRATKPEHRNPRRPLLSSGTSSTDRHDYSSA
jgi:hypothetical protein